MPLVENYMKRSGTASGTEDSVCQDSVAGGPERGPVESVHRVEGVGPGSMKREKVPS